MPKPITKWSYSNTGSLWRLLLLAVCLSGGILANGMLVRGQSEEDSTAVSSSPVTKPSVTPAAGATTTGAEPSKGIPRDPLGILLALGWFVYPLGLTSIIAAWVAIERLVVLRRGRVIPRHFVKRFFDLLESDQLDQKSAVKLCEENGSPVAFVFAHGLRKWGKPSVEVEQAIIDGGERQVGQLRSYLRVLNGAATVGPLLGLLGTVWGMVESFNTIAMKAAMGKSSELAAGIGLALLTTVVGLLVAIPSLVMYMYLSGRVDSLVMEMDSLAQELVDNISAEGLTEQRANRTAKPPETRRAV